MKNTLCLTLTLAIFISIISGCSSERVRFTEKGKFLKNSRGVRHNRKLKFKEMPTVKHSFNSLSDMKNFEIVNGEWKLENNKIKAVGGSHNRTILLTKIITPPFRIEFDVVNFANPNGSIGDITILINTLNSKKFFREGYTLTTGSYYNNCSTIYRLGKAMAKTEYSPVVSGRKNRVKVDYNQGHLRYWLNNEIIIEAWDPTPLTLDKNKWIGIRTWNTLMEIDNFSIHEAEKP
ncbi:MAG: hypothetical protein ACYTFY_06920 [Planctomycetota bacterium]|jgi:hypothetical protein